MKIDGKTISAAIGLIAEIEPEALTVYEAAKAIWTMAHPGATEADFVAFLIQASNQTISDADQILSAKGYVRDANTGAWTKPANG